MTLNYIQELNSRYVYIQDKKRVYKLIDDIIVGGKDNVQIIFDFDRTLTKPNECGNTCVSSVDLLNHCPSVTQKYVETVKELMSEGCRIEFNQTIPDSEKSELLGQLWQGVIQAIKGLPISYEELLETAAKVGPSLRDGTEQFFAELNKANIPVLVFSAGYGDSVKAILKHFDVLYSNIIANFFCFDKDVIQGFNNSYLVNTRNKNNLVSKDPEYVNFVKNRDNVILIGDSLGDANMADGIPNTKHILKIGFKCKRTGETLSDFLKVFDIVVEDSSTMHVVQDIFKHILKQ